MSGPGPGYAYLATLLACEGRPALAGARAALFCRVLAALRRRLGFRLHAFVVLPDRARLILSTPDGDRRSIEVIAQRLRVRFARELHARHGWPGRILRDESRLAPLRDAAEVARRAEHLHRAPVIAGLARRAAAWPWSSRSGWTGTGTPPAPVDLPEAVDGPRPRARPALSG